jgi:hypothetical protein
MNRNSRLSIGITIASIAVGAWFLAAALAGPVPARLAGVYTARFSGSELTSRGPSGHPLPAGMWRLTLRGRSATFTNPANGTTFPLGSGPVSVTGDRFVVGPSPSCPDQPGKATKGVYRFTLRRAVLTFRKVSESCNDRAATLTAHPFRRSR